MRLRTVVLPLAATLASVLVPEVAHAAVPKTKPTQTFACPTGQDGQARVWVRKNKKGRITKLAVDNPCAWYLGFAGGDDVMWVAPGSHFHWSQTRIREAQAAGHPVLPSQVAQWTDGIVCSGGENQSLIVRYNDVRKVC